MRSRRQILSGLAAVAAGTGITVTAAPVGAARPGNAVYAAIAANRDAWAVCWRAAQTEAEGEARASARRPAPLPNWRDWLKANRPEVAALDSDPCAGARCQAVLAELEAAEARPEGLDEAGRHQFARHLITAMVVDREDGSDATSEARAAYEALQVDRGNAIAAINEAEGVDAAGEAAEAAYADMANVRCALLAARPVTAAGFVAKVHALLTSWDDPGEAIDDDEAADLIGDALALAEAGAVPVFGGAA